MNKLQRVGFLREYSLNNDDQSIKEFGEEVLSKEVLNLILDYLEDKGDYLVISPGVVEDIFDSEKIAGSQSELTDGKWVWPEYLGFYLKEYNLKLPSLFLDHIMTDEKKD